MNPANTRPSRLQTFSSAALLVLTAQAAASGFLDGPKLVGTGGVPSGFDGGQGTSVALSADGSTALVGAANDSTYHTDGGAVWVFVRVNGHWSQQVELGTTEAGAESMLGTSVALSADGNTALVGAPGDGSGRGAFWVHTRSNGNWLPIGVKLVPDSASGTTHVGASVSLSSDGNTALVGGPGQVQMGGIVSGAAWVYTRSGSTWTQGPMLVGNDRGTPVAAAQGSAVALSADASTALVGGPTASSSSGAVWVYVQSGGSWSLQQMLSASGADESGAAQFGASLSVSADGSTALVGGPDDGSAVGAAWAWVRGAGSPPWTLQGSKLTSGTGTPRFGTSVALSSGGDLAIVGGPYDVVDSHQTGAALVFTRSNGAWSPASPLLPMTTSAPLFGSSAALSSDGSTALIGGPADDNAGPASGAVWVFIRGCVGPLGDVNGDGALNVADVFYTINFLFAGGPAPQCP